MGIHLSHKVVPNNVKLLESAVECLGGGHIDYISQPEDVTILFVLESVRVNIQEAILIC